MGYKIYTSEKTYSIQEFKRDIQAYKMYLKEMDVVAGERVLFTAENSYNFLIGFFALTELAVSIVLVDCLTGEKELNEIIKDCGSSVCISDKKLNLSPEIRRIQLNPPMKIDSLVEVGDSINPDWIHKEDALILYSSGSTGKPKGIVKSGTAFTLNLKKTMDVMRYQDDDVLLPLIPFTHFYGLSIVFLWRMMKCDLVLCDYKKIRSIIKAINDWRVTVVDGIPSTYHVLVNILKKREKIKENLKQSCVRMWCVGGAPLSSKLGDEFQSVLGKPLLDGYGLSELGNVALNVTTHKNGCGKSLEGVEVQVIDSKGLQLLNGEIGEIVVKTPDVMERYLNLPNETNLVLKDGWFKTNDLGYLDSHGNLFIIGRKGEEVVRKGYVIHPAKIEKNVEDALGIKGKIVTFHDEKKGAYMILFLEASPLENNGLKNAVTENLDPVLMPDKIVFLEKFPYLPNGKVDFVALKIWAAEYRKSGVENELCKV
ncbi:acyl--CoA ligase [Bacillus manliponensis]|uniref:Acyl--CoA ligase n=1 Tax=Bacillus manliponensis TaxID=574376 RepID=A0A073K3Y1_9BACI|nr:class I adenylate-forming enzyme family protein [Bacillus manliponensis]KEK21301.1 acyl--CoA ligase [Bacillus manliponensis]